MGSEQARDRENKFYFGRVRSDLYVVRECLRRQASCVNAMWPSLADTSCVVKGHPRFLRNYAYKWASVINPLVPGYGTGPEKTRFPECWVLPYIGVWFSSVFWYPANF